jgi:predicted nucleic acid-binding protein
MKLSFGNKYVVDTNVLITLINYYPQNNPTFKAIWDEIEELIKQNNMFTTSVVYDEITRYMGEDDRVKKWAKAHRKLFFTLTNPEIFQLAKDIIKDFSDLPDKKKLQTGEPDADPFLIALAQSEGATIITQEKDDPNKTKIPKVAKHYDIKCIDLFEFFKERGLKFIKEQ